MHKLRSWWRLDRLGRHRRTIAALVAGGAMVGATIAIVPVLSHGLNARDVAATTVVQGGCNPYQVQANGAGTFSAGTYDMRVCVSDNGTGTTAYPEVIVDQVPPYLATSCTIGIELWDNAGTGYGTPGLGDCKVGSYPGNPFKATKQLTLHAFARLKICLLTVCTSYYLGKNEGNSPAIDLRPFVDTATETTTAPAVSGQAQPDPIKVPPPLNNGQQRANCLTTSPTTGTVERNGNGWNQYTTDQFGRPGTASACLDSTRIQGSIANPAITYGMQDALAKVDQWNAGSDPPSPPLNRTRAVNSCHLIANVLGGNGQQRSNLVPCTATLSRTANQYMRVAERSLNGQLGQLPLGDAIYYQVTPKYADNGNTSTIPSSIVLTAVLQVPGQPDYPILSQTIANTIIVKGAVSGKQLTLMLGN